MNILSKIVDVIYILLAMQYDSNSEPMYLQSLQNTQSTENILILNGVVSDCLHHETKSRDCVRSRESSDTISKQLVF